MAGFLANIAKTQKVIQKREKPTLIPHVDEYLMTRPEQDRRDGKFHPSDLSYRFCPRAWALYNYHPEGLNTKKAGFTSRTYRIFDNGHGLHDRTQRYLQMRGLLWGRWTRVLGYDYEAEKPYVEEHIGFAPKLKDGRVDPSWTYAEVKIRNERRNITGHTDGIMPIKGVSRHGFEYGKWGFEAKSINDRAFGWLSDEAKDYHIDQTLIYSDCLEEERKLGEEDMWAEAEGYDFWQQPLEGFIVFYENKNDQTIKEYAVEFSEEKVNEFFERLEPRMDEALAYKAEVEAGGSIHYPFCRCPKTPELLCKKFNIG